MHVRIVFKRLIAASIYTTLFLGCIGTDVLEDVIVGESVEILVNTKSVLLNESIQLEAIYRDQYGFESESLFSWQSSETTIASINEQGVLTAASVGQTEITATTNGVSSEPVLITVVAGPDDIAQIIISPTNVSLDINESVQLSATVYNYNDEELADKSITWSNSDPEIATIDSNGLLTGLANGTSQISASVENISSDPLTITVGNSIKTAILEGNAGYTAEGTATLFFGSNNELTLELSDDFQTSFALGTFIYLANSTDGSTVKSSGLELGEITTNGAKSFNISEIDKNVDLETYQYVIILCKPASISFGFGEFN